MENVQQDAVVKPAASLASKSTWGDCVRGTKLSDGQMTLADLYSVARNPASSSHSLGSQLPPLPQRVKGYPTPYLTHHEIESLLSPLCSRSGWKVEFRLPSDSEPERAALSDCGCAPQDLPPQELPFLISTYHFSSIQAADDFLADAKLLSDVGEFHHYDSYSLTPTSADGSFQLASPASLTLFVQTHSAINSSSVRTPGLTIRDVRYAAMLDHLYYSLYASGVEQPEVGSTLDDSTKRRLIH